MTDAAGARLDTAPPTGDGAPPIPFFDLRLRERDVEAVARCLRSGWLTMGPCTRAFEEAFAGELGVRHAVALSSATAGLHLAYLAAGVGAGDEVIVPSYTFVATAAAVLYCGATPVFADIIGEDDLSLDPEDVRRLLSPRTKAVACVHFAGFPAPADTLAELCAEAGVALIEDAAHAPGATLHGRGLGTWGRVGVFSLFANKILSVGEGGLLVTDDDEVAGLARSLRSHAMSSGTWERHSGVADGYDVLATGFNYRIDEPRSALAHSRLDQLESDIRSRRRLTRAYRERLRGHTGLSVPYADEAVAQASCNMMAVLLRDGARRDELRGALRERYGIQTSVHFPPVHRFSAYRERFPDVRLPRTEAVSARELTLPLFAHMSDAQLDRVIDALWTELPG
ncbi:MAG TPA: DegT/DnrJ/EryC1/StrS family aminotransferase [Solirubrobacteraceae bacterium]|nr:DegT/DnrJ/EryC1/StrS family aminotransferase [Solirubrobacteraceae bacterium]